MFISPSLPSLPIYFLWLQKRVLKNEMNVSRKLRNLESNSERMEPGCGSGSNSQAIPSMAKRHPHKTLTNIIPQTNFPQ